MARVDWNQPAHVIARLIRAFTPVPGAWTEWDGNKVKLGPVFLGNRDALNQEQELLRPGQVRIGKKCVDVGTGSECVRLSTVQAPGKKMMDAAAWARGVHDQQGIVWE